MRPNSTASATPRRSWRQARGVRTREVILRKAVDIASVQGLEGLTVGTLANALGMSKSGLFGHFGSKRVLQLATVDAARQIFIDSVIKPSLTAPKGMPRLWRLVDRWIAHVENHVFSGGCFFTAASFEFDSRRGPVRDRIAAVMREWMGTLTRAVHAAQKEGHIPATVDPAGLAQELQSYALGAHWATQLLEDRAAYAGARVLALQRLRSLATANSPRVG
ncbi:MAG TPA: TetR/AcrR family transcriptional regulator [Candidatus Eremiobacteraceae bacterium]|nr:TetR/AcrR family transcriptional regulator [Candidatus Eremiobacteraceae bacterium]